MAESGPSTPGHRLRILIIGAGIAGLTLALQLQLHASAYYEVVVFEKSPLTIHTARCGYVILLSPNAVHILRRLSVDAVKLGFALPLTRTVIHHASRPCCVVGQTENFFDDPEQLLIVERGPLQQEILRRFVKEGGIVRWGVKVEGVEEVEDEEGKKGARRKRGGGEGIRVRFGDGTTERGDLVVGADGVHSFVRKALYTGLSPPSSSSFSPSRHMLSELSRILSSTLASFKSLVPPLLSSICSQTLEQPWRAQPTPWTALYGISENPPPGALQRAQQNEYGNGEMHWWMMSSRAGAYTTYSLPRGRLAWICYSSSPCLSFPPISSSPALSSAEESEKERVSFDAMPYWPLTVSSSPSEMSIIPFGLITNQDPPGEADSKGRPVGIRKTRLHNTLFPYIANKKESVVLVGDAAHPMVTFHGQGACMGIEESVVLTNALLRQAWETEERDRVGQEKEMGVTEEDEMAYRGAGEVGETGGILWYVEQRRERTRRVSELGWWFGFAIMGDWWLLRCVRDWAAGWVLATPSRSPSSSGTKQTAKETQNGEERKEIERQEKNWLFDAKLEVETKTSFLETASRKEKRAMGEAAGSLSGRCGSRLDSSLTDQRGGGPRDAW